MNPFESPLTEEPTKPPSPPRRQRPGLKINGRLLLGLILGGVVVFIGVLYFTVGAVRP
ncbi:MAG: hypothetical protein AAF790_12895 [Planctomycetota bacterium]